MPARYGGVPMVLSKVPSLQNLSSQVALSQRTKIIRYCRSKRSLNDRTIQLLACLGMHEIIFVSLGRVFVEGEDVNYGAVFVRSQRPVGFCTDVDGDVFGLVPISGMR